MDEYIKREDALDAVLFALAGTGLQSKVISAIKAVPTADVANSSDIAKEIFESIKNVRHNLMGSPFYSYTDAVFDLIELEKKYTTKTQSCRDCADHNGCEKATHFENYRFNECSDFKMTDKEVK